MNNLRVHLDSDRDRKDNGPYLIKKAVFEPLPNKQEVYMIIDAAPCVWSQDDVDSQLPSNFPKIVRQTNIDASQAFFRLVWKETMAQIQLIAKMAPTA